MQTVDHVALLPAYLAAGTAVLVLLADLLVAAAGARPRGRWPPRGAVGRPRVGAVVAGAAGRPRRTFCVGAGLLVRRATARPCSIAAVFAAADPRACWRSPRRRCGRGDVPAGEYCFLLACSMTGGVVLGAAGDLITLIVALETLTLPLYVLVGLRRRRAGRSAEAAVTFFVVSVVSTAVTLLGAALLYARDRRRAPGPARPPRSLAATGAAACR